ncbi:hypothetical protein NLJ89_g11152 [Agrocybe chaxingu]|uniref:DUF6532 domain-containing protein n=1 Tax=Agrocybe chaxingu TaxID=84603 RepID=A0A9W8JME5_9AGAR|nr:hypothetical protein NLJ89_g11152 [Agrocybe chaxingu]
MSEQHPVTSEEDYPFSASSLPPSLANTETSVYNFSLSNLLPPLAPPTSRSFPSIVVSRKLHRSTSHPYLSTTSKSGPSVQKSKRKARSTLSAQKDANENTVTPIAEDDQSSVSLIEADPQSLKALYHQRLILKSLMSGRLFYHEKSPLLSAYRSDARTELDKLLTEKPELNSELIDHDQTRSSGIRALTTLRSRTKKAYGDIFVTAYGLDKAASDPYAKSQNLLKLGALILNDDANFSFAHNPPDGSMGRWNAPMAERAAEVILFRTKKSVGFTETESFGDILPIEILAMSHAMHWEQSRDWLDGSPCSSLRRIVEVEEKYTRIYEEIILDEGRHDVGPGVLTLRREIWERLLKKYKPSTSSASLNTVSSMAIPPAASTSASSSVLSTAPLSAYSTVMAPPSLPFASIGSLHFPSTSTDPLSMYPYYGQPEQGSYSTDLLPTTSSLAGPPFTPMDAGYSEYSGYASGPMADNNLLYAHGGVLC